MQPIILKRKSWHRWLALHSDRLSQWEDETDICSYTGYVLLGLFKTALIAFVATIMFTGLCLLVAAVLSGFYYVFFSPLSWEELLNGKGWVGFSFAWAVMTTFAATILAILSVSKKLLLFTNASALAARQSPGFIGTAYRSWKDKTCFKIKFTEE